MCQHRLFENNYYHIQNVKDFFVCFKRHADFCSSLTITSSISQVISISKRSRHTVYRAVPGAAEANNL